MLFVKSVFATICLLTLVFYDFLCICRILKRENIVRKIWEYLFSSIKYNEIIVFTLGKTILLSTSMIFFLVSSDVLLNFWEFKILLSMTPFFALGAMLRSIQK